MTDLGSPTYDRVDPSTLDQDPFWSTFRRRHPDVEIVITPEPVAEGGTTTVPSAAPDAVAEVVRRLVSSLAAVHAGAAGAETRGPSLRWSARGGGHALVASVAVLGLGQDGGARLLRALARDLDPLGWAFDPGWRGEHPLLRASDGLIDLEAEAGPGATSLTLASGVLGVPAEVRDAVLATAREEVATWR